MKDSSYKHSKKLAAEDKYKKKMFKLINRVRYFPSGAYFKTDDSGIKYIKRYYRGSRSSYLKKVGNKKVRRYLNEIKSGSSYRKIFDYWWELY